MSNVECEVLLLSEFINLLVNDLAGKPYGEAFRTARDFLLQAKESNQTWVCLEAILGMNRRELARRILERANEMRKAKKRKPLKLKI